jgi:hypothetical protein|tara:strand:+ start:386 stop:553 length:168 start_codon:yes stop_codon:yes gene_type:complete
MKNIFIILLLFSITLAQQISRSDIEKLGKLQLESVKSEEAKSRKIYSYGNKKSER